MQVVGVPVVPMLPVVWVRTWAVPAGASPVRVGALVVRVGVVVGVAARWVRGMITGTRACRGGRRAMPVRMRVVVRVGAHARSISSHLRRCEGVGLDATQPDTGSHPLPDEPSPEQVGAATAVFGMLADPTRLRILWALRDGEELDVTTLAERTRVGATATSQHLTKLRLAGLVVPRKQGRRVFYRARGGHFRRLLIEALFHTDHQLTGKPDHD